jgi:chromosome segregation ATPase
MKTKVALIVLILMCVALGVVLMSRSRQAAEEHQRDVEIIVAKSNELVRTTTALEEEKQTNLKLNKDADERKSDMAKLSNDLSVATENLAKSEVALKSALEETAKRDAKITELETENESLDKQAADLKTTIGNLESQIADTQKKLASAEGDKAFLEKELKRLVSEKQELERQFNDLAVLKQQVHKLKEELYTARRLDWKRQGIYAAADMKGAQKLLQGPNAGSMARIDTNRYDLNVEVNADGTVKVISPITTNAAPATPTPQ